MNGVKIGAGAYRWATISIPWLVAAKTPIPAMITQSTADWGCRQIHGNIGVRNTMPSDLRPGERRLGEVRSSELAGGQHISRIANNARDGDKNDRLKRPCSWACRNQHAEKSERDCDHAFRAHSFTQHRSCKKSHEDRREK